MGCLWGDDFEKSLQNRIKAFKEYEKNSVIYQLRDHINLDNCFSVKSIVGDGTKLLDEIEKGRFNPSDNLYVPYVVEPEKNVKYEDILFLMIQYGYVDIVKRFLEKGVRIGARKYFICNSWLSMFHKLYGDIRRYRNWRELEGELNETVVPVLNKERALILELLEQYGEIDKGIDLTKLILLCRGQYPKNDIQLYDVFDVNLVLNEMDQLESLYYDMVDSKIHIPAIFMPEELYDIFDFKFLDSMIRWGEIRIIEKLFDMYVYTGRRLEIKEKIGDMYGILLRYQEAGLKYLKSKEKSNEYLKQLLYIFDLYLDMQCSLNEQECITDWLTSGYYTGDVSSGNDFFMYLLDKAIEFSTDEDMLNTYIYQVNNLDMFLRLLEMGAEVDYKSAEILKRAVESVDVALLDYIIEQGKYSLEQLEEYKSNVRNKDILEELIVRGVTFSKEDLIDIYDYAEFDFYPNKDKFRSYILSKIDSCCTHF